jgi:hypothetical protein
VSLARERFETMTSAELEVITRSGDYRPDAQQLAREILGSRSSASASERPCPAHPAMQAVATCVRCGTFICYDCDASFGRSRTGRCPACQALVGAPKTGLAQNTLVKLLVFGLVVRAVFQLMVWLH